MTKFLTCFIVGLFCVFSLATSAQAQQDPQKFMTTIYGGLADIIEQNMNNPSQCIAAVEAFGQRHKAEIDRLSAISEGNREQAMQQQQDYSTEDIDMEKMEQAMEAMAQSEGYQAMNRFMQAMQNFSMQNEDYSEQLGDALEDVFPEPPEEDY